MKTTEPLARMRTTATKNNFKEILDIEMLDAAAPEKAVKQFEIKAKPRIVKCDLVIVGGGMGGVAAALAACDSGLKVCLSEETAWLGGQMTSQGVSAFDENYLVESSGATKRYKAFRKAIRDHYAQLGGVAGQARFEPYLDPGNSWVSRLAFEPKVAVKLLSELLQPYIAKGQLQLLMRAAALSVRFDRNKIRALQCVDLDTGKVTEMRCKFCIDATELGDLLPLAKVEYRSGAESREDTGEAHAPLVAQPENVQDFTYPFVVEFRPGENHTIAKPPHYDEFAREGKFSFNGYRMFEDSHVVNTDGRTADYMPFWEYRRLIARSNFPNGAFPNDIAMINWDSNDLRGENIIDQKAATAGARLALGKYVSLGFLYWLQTEAPRDDGGKGYPELKLRADILGSNDGLSKYPYIRESRRIKARYTVVEGDIVSSANASSRARLFDDSLGIGLYPVDIHGKQDVPGAGQNTRPFQFPAAALVQDSIRNFLPACKNIGTTHVSNGAYRLHPIEWAIGEAAGTFAAEVLKHHTDIVRVLDNKRALRRLQDCLLEAGAPLFWFDDISPEDHSFASIQFVTICGLVLPDKNSLSFRPDEPLTRGDAAFALARILRLKSSSSEKLKLADLQAADPAYEAAALCLEHSVMTAARDNRFRAEDALSGEEFQKLSKNKMLRESAEPLASQTISRRQFADWLYRLCKQERFFGRL